MNGLGLTIVSGGQTGVDQGALDAALELGAACQGWCPADRRSEDGPIDARYPLRELEEGGYAERTRRNVGDADGTLIIDFSTACSGTELTGRYARELGRPLLLIDAGSLGPAEAAARVRAFVERHRIRVLNVAGPRASSAPAAHAYTRAVVRKVLQS